MKVNNVEVEGLKELEDLFKQLPLNIGGRALKATLRNAAREMFEEVRRRVPQDTGALRDSLRLKTARTPDPENANVIIHTSYYYGRMLETGTRNMSAHPFMGPAFDATADQFVENFKEEAQIQIDRAVRKVGEQNFSAETLGEVVANRKRVQQSRQELHEAKRVFIKQKIDDLRSRIGEERYRAMPKGQQKAMRKYFLNEARKQLGFYKPKAP